MVRELSFRLVLLSLLAFAFAPALYGSATVLERIAAGDPAAAEMIRMDTVETEEGETVFEVEGRRVLFTRNRQPVDPEKYYSVQITARSAGDEPTRFLFGFVPEDGSGRRITPESGGYAVAGSFTRLLADASEGDIALRVADASLWEVSERHSVAFGAAEDLSDLPNFNLIRGVAGIRALDEGYEVTLNSPLEENYPAGTGLRQHISRSAAPIAGTYFYIGFEDVPTEWTQISSRQPFRGDRIAAGIEAMGLVLLPNRDSEESVTQIREIILKEFPEPELKEREGLKSAERMFEKRVDVPEGIRSISTELRCGPGGVRVFLSWPDGSAEELTLRPFDHKIGEAELGGAGIELSPGRVRNYVRPNISRYNDNVADRYIETWDELPSAYDHSFGLELRRASGGAAVWFDGRYAGRIEHPGGVDMRRIAFEVMPGSAVGPVEFTPAPAAGRYLPLDITRLPAAAALPEGAGLAFDEADSSGGRVGLGRSVIPFKGQEGVWIDIDKTYRDLRASSQAALLGRSSFDGLSDSALITVPAEQYARAWLLCTVDDDPEKDPAVTARLTRFVEGNGRGRDALADVTVELPRAGEEPGPGVERVGVLKIDGAASPLWLVEVPLAAGAIQDLLWQEDPVRGTLGRIGAYLDFELLGKLTERAHPFRDRRWMPQAGVTSGVKVLGITLEKTPVEMEVGQSRPGNIFHGEEEPEMPVQLRSKKAGEYVLRWETRDAEGGRTYGEKMLDLKAGESREEVISLRQPELGWYGIDVELWEGGRRLVKYPASFALLAPDTREAGFESPYGSWWFGSHHYGTSDEAIAGELLKKLGFRRTHINHGGDRTRLSEEILAPWKLTNAMVGDIINRKRRRGESDEEIIEHVRDHTERFPNIKYAMIFHESYPWSYNQAPELIGMSPGEAKEREMEGADERWEMAFWAGKLLRENFPELKIIIGNSLGSSEFIAEGLRRGFPEEYADYTGNETVNRTALPERLSVVGAQCFWLQREIAREYGYGWGVASCYEYNYRPERLMGERLQAEWYVRDNLVALAYGAPYISTALLYDTGNSYQHSFWGASGLCRRYPLLFPKKAYVAMSVLTRALDRGQLQRKVPTGSNSIYALEFDRPDGKKVYAIWTSRGTADLSISLGRRVGAEITDIYGRSRKTSSGLRGVVNLTAGTAVKYLLVPGSVREISYGSRSYPGDIYYMDPDEFTVVNPMSDPGQWELAEGPDPLLENTDGNMPYRTAGEYILRGVRDAEKGLCLEVELVPDYDLPAIMNEYAVIRLKEPVEVPGRPDTMGVWVKGNSGWGQVYFEIEDAGGVRRISCGTPVHNADVFDYDGRMSINFDGWHFLSFPVTGESPIPDLSTGSVANLWHSRGAPLDREGVSEEPVYPVKVTGVAVSLPPRALYLSEMNRISQVLRFRDLGVYEHGRQ